MTEQNESDSRSWLRLLLLVLVVFFAWRGPSVASWVLRTFSTETDRHLQGALLFWVMAFGSDNNIPEVPVDRYASGERPLSLFTLAKADTVAIKIEAPCKIKLSDSAHVKVTADWSLTYKPLPPKPSEEVRRWLSTQNLSSGKAAKESRASSPSPVPTRPPLILTLTATSLEVTDAGGDHKGSWLWLLRPKSVGRQELTLAVSTTGTGYILAVLPGKPTWSISQKCPDEAGLYQYDSASQVLLGNTQVVSDLGFTAKENALFGAVRGILGVLSVALSLPFLRGLFGRRS